MRVDSAYGRYGLPAWVAQAAHFLLGVVRRPLGAAGFVLLPGRWVVERTFAWLGRWRRLSKDYEYETAHSEAWIQISTVHLLLRRLRPDTENPQPKFKYPKSKNKAA